MTDLRERVREACRAWNLAVNIGEHIDAGEAMHDLLVRGVLTNAEPTDSEPIGRDSVDAEPVDEWLYGRPPVATEPDGERIGGNRCRECKCLITEGMCSYDCEHDTLGLKERPQGSVEAVTIHTTILPTDTGATDGQPDG